MAKSFTRLISTGFGALLVIGAAHAAENALPDPLAKQLSDLIQGSVAVGQINPAIYTLAISNPDYADEIACISVQFFGQPDVIEQQILQGISDPDQQKAVDTAVKACSEKEVAGGYGVALATFNEGLRGGGLNTLSNTQDNVSPVEP
ncbi:MAG: hypothetical protein GC201_06885 [Alphaproteobacteria bacterium]|nr:hypothetical protein [Alphaproteobacteria bacterium]